MLSLAANCKKRSSRALECSGPIPSKPCGNKQHEAAEPAPFVFGADDELIDDHLGRVDEVAELRLPHHQAVGAIETVAVLEAQHAGFRQRAVVNFDRRLIGRQIRQRHVIAGRWSHRAARRGDG